MRQNSPIVSQIKVITAANPWNKGKPIAFFPKIAKTAMQYNEKSRSPKT